MGKMRKERKAHIAKGIETRIVDSNWACKAKAEEMLSGAAHGSSNKAETTRSLLHV